MFFSVGDGKCSTLVGLFVGKLKNSPLSNFLLWYAGCYEDTQGSVSGPRMGAVRGPVSESRNWSYVRDFIYVIDRTLLFSQNFSF